MSIYTLKRTPQLSPQLFFLNTQGLFFYFMTVCILNLICNLTIPKWKNRYKKYLNYNNEKKAWLFKKILKKTSNHRSLEKKAQEKCCRSSGVACFFPLIWLSTAVFFKKKKDLVVKVQALVKVHDWLVMV